MPFGARYSLLQRVPLRTLLFVAADADDTNGGAGQLGDDHGRPLLALRRRQLLAVVPHSATALLHPPCSLLLSGSAPFLGASGLLLLDSLHILCCVGHLWGLAC